MLFVQFCLILGKRLISWTFIEVLSEKIKLLDIPSLTKLDFLTDRKQRVKLGDRGLSNWSVVRARVPQRSKLGPWLYLLMINDLGTSTNETWKFVDDTTLSCRANS
jgi:hypothetical protein